VDSLYTELQQEEDPDRKKTLVSDLKSKICNAKEQKFCCDCNCVKREECPAINELYTNFEQETDKDKKRSLLSDLKKKICSAKEKTFCCDVKASATPTTSPSYEGTFLPRLEDGKCGKIGGSSEFILGGEAAKIGEFPFTALLRMRDQQKKYGHRFNCGGNLINTRYVLTAAHCYQENNPLNLVRLGEYNAVMEGRDCVEEACLPPVQDFEVSLDDFIIHKDYVFDKIKRIVINDIGLIRLPREAVLHQGVQMVCLPLSAASRQQETPESLGTIVGWGFTSFKDQRLDSNRIDFNIATEIQQKANMTLISQKQCKEMWGDSIGSLTDGQVCAFNLGVSTCKGDSGGPLYTKGDSKNSALTADNSVAPWTLTGITSFGSTFCKGRSKPPVFTKVSAYIDWIKEHLEP